MMPMDTLAIIGAHEAVIMHVPWSVAWVLALLVVTGMGTVFFTVREMIDSALRAVGWR